MYIMGLNSLIIMATLMYKHILYYEDRNQAQYARWGLKYYTEMIPQPVGYTFPNITQ